MASISCLLEEEFDGTSSSSVLLGEALLRARPSFAVQRSDVAETRNQMFQNQKSLDVACKCENRALL